MSLRENHSGTSPVQIGTIAQNPPIVILSLENFTPKKKKKTRVRVAFWTKISRPEVHTYGSLCKTLGSAKLPLVDLWVIGRIQPPVKKYPAPHRSEIIRVRRFSFMDPLDAAPPQSLWVIKFDGIFSLCRAMMQNCLLVLLSSLAFYFHSWISMTQLINFGLSNSLAILLYGSMMYIITPGYQFH